MQQTSEHGENMITVRTDRELGPRESEIFAHIVGGIAALAPITIDVEYAEAPAEVRRSA